jgi:hypothetical protein
MKPRLVPGCGSAAAVPVLCQAASLACHCFRQFPNKRPDPARSASPFPYASVSPAVETPARLPAFPAAAAGRVAPASLLMPFVCRPLQK